MAGERVPFNQEKQQLFDGLPDRHQMAVRLALGMTPERFRDDFDAYGPLEGSLDLLPQFDRQHTRAVCNAMVSSQDETHRMRLTDSVDVILSHDFEYGCALWDRLIGDPSPTVRRNAHEVLEEHLRGRQSPGEHPSNVVGEPYLDQLTWMGACNLLRTFVAAEVDGIRYQLGPVALTGADALPPNEPRRQAPSTDPTVT